MGTLIDLTDRKFGRLTVVKYVGMVGHHSFWHCVCDCGNEVDVASYKLRTGHTSSCGCLHKEQLSQRNTKHGLANSRLYMVYASMKRRCYSESDQEYSSYGGRGIRVCDEWLNDFKAFYDWAIDNGYDAKAKRGVCTLDRIDNDGNYCPENCRWISIYQQNRKRKEVEAAFSDGTVKRFWSMRSAGTSLGIDFSRIRDACASGKEVCGATWRVCNRLKLLGDPSLYVSGVPAHSVQQELASDVAS